MPPTELVQRVLNSFNGDVDKAAEQLLELLYKQADDEEEKAKQKRREESKRTTIKKGKCAESFEEFFFLLETFLFFESDFW